MSLELSGTTPVSEITIMPFLKNGQKIILLNGVEIPMEEFTTLVMYVMCSTGLVPNDARLKLLEEMRSVVPQSKESESILVGHGDVGRYFQNW